MGGASEEFIMFTKLKAAAEANRPATAGGLAGAVTVLILALAEWGLEGLHLPDPVQGAILLVAVTTTGSAFGKVAQRKTWPDDTHKAGIAYALQLDPVHWEEALAALDLTRTEALEAIGVDPNEVP